MKPRVTDPPEGAVCGDCDEPLTPENTWQVVESMRGDDDIPVTTLVCHRCYVIHGKQEEAS